MKNWINGNRTANILFLDFTFILELPTSRSRYIWLWLLFNTYLFSIAVYWLSGWPLGAVTLTDSIRWMYFVPNLSCRMSNFGFDVIICISELSACCRILHSTLIFIITQITNIWPNNTLLKYGVMFNDKQFEIPKLLESVSEKYSTSTLVAIWNR